MHILTGLPTRDGTLSNETEYSLTHNHDGLGLLRIMTSGLGVIDARNTIASQMMNCGDDSEQVCLWIDSDAFFQSGTITKLVTALKELPMRSLVAGYFTYRRRGSPAVALKFPNHLAAPVAGVDPDLCPVFTVGFHFVVHRLGLLKLMPTNPFDVPFEDEHEWEDRAFVARLRSIGGQAYVLTTAPVAHVDIDTGLAYLPHSEPFKIINNELAPYVRPRYKTYAEFAAAKSKRAQVKMRTY